MANFVIRAIDLSMQNNSENTSEDTRAMFMDKPLPHFVCGWGEAKGYLEFETRKIQNMIIKQSELTFGAWVRPSTLKSQIQVIIYVADQSDNPILSLIMVNGKFVFSAGSGGENIGYFYPEHKIIVDKWIFVCLSVNLQDGILSFYIDGLQIMSINHGFSHSGFSMEVEALQYPVCVGHKHDNDFQDTTFNGGINMAFMMTKFLNEADINSIWEQTKKPYDSANKDKIK